MQKNDSMKIRNYLFILDYSEKDLKQLFTHKV